VSDPVRIESERRPGVPSGGGVDALEQPSRSAAQTRRLERKGTPPEGDARDAATKFLRLDRLRSEGAGLDGGAEVGKSGALMTSLSGRNALVAGLVALAIALAIFWPRPVSPEEAVRRAAVQMVRQAEDRDLSGFTDHVSGHFVGPDNADRLELKRLLAGLLLPDRWVRVFLADLSVNANPDGTVGCVARVIFARSRAESLKELAAQSVFGAYEVHANFTREQDGVWRATSGSYTQLDPKALISPDSARFH
jgi:hypothetical protein